MNRIGWTKKKATIALVLCVIIAVSSIMILQNSQTTQAALINPHPGLVGWWRFDEGSGTLAGDSSGNGNNGTISSASWVTGRYGKALQFAGIFASRVQVPYSPSLAPATAVTVECWVNMIAPDTIISRDYGLGYNLLLVNGKAVFAITDPINNKMATSVTTVLNTGWHKLVGTFDGTFVKIYVDGALENSLAIGGTVMSGTSPLMIGANNYGGAGAGVIDEVLVYNRALSATEIQADFQQSPDFSPYVLAKVPMGTTQVITTLSWQGTGSLNVTIVSPSQTYTESMVPVYQKTTYSTSDGQSSMLNIKRVSVSVNALTSDQNWNVTLTFDNPVPYQITVEVQK